MPLYKDHEYELVSTYDNTTPDKQDAMATMFFYLYDHQADRALEYLSRRASWAAEAH